MDKPNTLICLEEKTVEEHEIDDILFLKNSKQ